MLLPGSTPMKRGPEGVDRPVPLKPKNTLDQFDPAYISDMNGQLSNKLKTGG